MAERAASTGHPTAGLWVGPAAWFLNQEGSYALTPWVCATQVHLVPVLAVVAAGFCLAVTFLSWTAWRAEAAVPGRGQPRRFLAAIGVGTGLIMAAVIMLQGAAGFVFHGCER